MSDLYVARIIEDDTGKVVRESKPTSRSRAERIEDGMSINLDHEHYSTDVETVDGLEGTREGVP